MMCGNSERAKSVRLGLQLNKLFYVRHFRYVCMYMCNLKKNKFLMIRMCVESYVIAKVKLLTTEFVPWEELLKLHKIVVAFRVRFDSYSHSCWNLAVEKI